MEWFRMYHEARNDRKLATLSDAEHRVWFDLMCLASENKTARGSVSGYTTDLLALEAAHGSVALLVQTVDKLKTLRIVRVDGEDEDTLIFINWGKRQYDKPSDLPENVKKRVSEHREREANKKEALQGVTPRYAALRNDQNRTDTEQIQNRSESEAQIAPNGAAHSRPLRDALACFEEQLKVPKANHVSLIGDAFKEAFGIDADFARLGRLHREYGAAFEIIKLIFRIAGDWNGVDDPHDYLTAALRNKKNGNGKNGHGQLVKASVPVAEVASNPEWEKEWDAQEAAAREVNRSRARWSSVRPGEIPRG